MSRVSHECPDECGGRFRCHLCFIRNGDEGIPDEYPYSSDEERCPLASPPRHWVARRLIAKAKRNTFTIKHLDQGANGGLPIAWKPWNGERG
ncbi:unnamed protein product, partial [Amoebophrya sp. A25]|eukprot:GSA25T00028075001.1